MRPHLTYIWLREDGTPYYVGKDSSGQRAFRKGSPPIERIIVQEWPTEQDALDAEKFLISFYGRRDLGTGLLLNFTDGGEGTSGRIYLEQSRLKRAEAAKNNPRRWKLSEETKAKMRKPKSPEHRLKLAIKLRMNRYQWTTERAKEMSRLGIAAQGNIAERVQSLTTEQAQVVKLFLQFNVPQWRIARMLKTSQMTVSRICQGKTYVNA